MHVIMHFNMATPLHKSPKVHEIYNLIESFIPIVLLHDLHIFSLPFNMLWSRNVIQRPMKGEDIEVFSLQIL